MRTRPRPNAPLPRCVRISQSQTPVEVGAAACQFTGPAPRNLAFQRDAYVVIMSGDVTYFPAQELDKRWVFGISGG
ncbi:MAG: hypothetical protein V9G20_08375 [Candidatus Promineifilaceae bacterium]